VSGQLIFLAANSNFRKNEFFGERNFAFGRERQLCAEFVELLAVIVDQHGALTKSRSSLVFREN
jgi:hypothetical protein